MSKNLELVKLKAPTREEIAKKDPSEYNEKEKMMSGLSYNAFGHELVSARKFAQVRFLLMIEIRAKSSMLCVVRE